MESDFQVKPFEKIEQFVGGEAAKMAVHQSEIAASRECVDQEERPAAIFSLVVRQEDKLRTLLFLAPK